MCCNHAGTEWELNGTIIMVALKIAWEIFENFAGDRRTASKITFE